MFGRKRLGLAKEIIVTGAHGSAADKIAEHEAEFVYSIAELHVLIVTGFLCDYFFLQFDRFGKQHTHPALYPALKLIELLGVVCLAAGEDILTWRAFGPLNEHQRRVVYVVINRTYDFGERVV